MVHWSHILLINKISESMQMIFQMHKGMTSDLVKKGTAKRERRTLIMVMMKNLKNNSNGGIALST